MRKIVCFICLVLSFSFLEAQDTYIVNGEQLELKKEVDGKLDLFWNIIDGNYRYFVKSESSAIMELTNTKKDGKFQEEYKTLLNELTNATMSAKRLNLTLFSLKEFVDSYNSSVDSSYQSTVKRNKLMFRLGVFGGITNSPFVSNPDNLTTPFFGGELEVLDVNQISRHAAFLQVKHVLEQDELQYSTTELALGYRFRFINKAKFSLYGNVKFATLNFSNVTITTEDNGTITTENFNDTSFDAPLIFGVGADIRVSENSFITLGYNELFALFLDNQGNFSTDFSIGYKFNL
ncbi:outer membrane beta-barrel protein [Psychroserpens algicola]|uniref:Porin family protein n=1 Tax=Psychroserpens algicola TaxID=1719034 RepID=A0ABT0H668_9FLAO|nr:outer membrane beta-barrel protein [Psychroserpens algicola]MCK8479317.1 porin family protein [Psychroserpens algicola]